MEQAEAQPNVEQGLEHNNEQELNEEGKAASDRQAVPSTRKAAARRQRMHSADLAHDDVPDIETVKRKNTLDYSKPVLVKKLTLGSTQAQVLFEHVYIRVDYSLYVCTKATRSQGRVAVARKVEAALDEMYEAFSQELAQTLAAMREMLEKKVPEEDRQLTYDHKREFKVPVRTGYATRLIHLTQMFDELIGTTETLEINNVISPENCDRTIKSWSRRYRSFCRAINVLRVESYDRSQSNSDSVSASKSETNELVVAVDNAGL